MRSLHLPTLLASCLLVSQAASQTCNLLDSAGTSYKDYSTFSAISTLCSGDTSSLSAWEQYQCDYTHGRNETCWPRRYFSTCEPGQLAGLAFLFHGYSACPDQYKLITPLLQEQCYHVYLPCTVGHGLDYCMGNSNVTDCTEGGYNLTELPTKRGGYIDFIDYMNEVMSEEVAIVKDCETTASSSWDEDNFDTYLGGLSLGAALSATAGVRQDLYDIVWDKQVLMSPFLGVSYGGADEIIYKCALNEDEFRSCLPYYFESIGLDFDLSNGSSSVFVNLTYDLIASYADLEFIDSSYETLNLLIRDILTYVVETNDSLVVDSEDTQGLLDTQIGWGTGCQSDQLNYGRGGFCNFLVRNLLAAHSLGSYVLDNVEDSIERDITIDTQLVMVERDGPVRNSLAAYYVQMMFGNDETMISERTKACMWLISAECQADDDREIDNTCGVPHSSMAVADNVGKDPGYLWWNETYTGGVVAFAIDGTYPSKFNDESAWDGGMTQCISVDINDPPAELIADVPQRFELILNLAKENWEDAVQDAILNRIAAISGVPRGVLELTIKVVESINANDYTDDSTTGTDSSTNGGSDTTDTGDVEPTTEDTTDDTTDDEDNYVLVETFLTESAAQVMTALLDYDALDEIAGYNIVYSTVSGTSYTIETDTETDDEDDSDGAMGVSCNLYGSILMIMAVISGAMMNL